jgi:hypothetical protein
LSAKVHAPDSLKKLEKIVPSVGWSTPARRIFFVSFAAAELHSVRGFLRSVWIALQRIDLKLNRAREYCIRRRMGAPD